MKLFQDETGRVFAFGFDMAARKPDQHMICWDDGQGNWEVAAGAGSVRLRYVIAPEFVHEVDARIVAYQPGMMIELIYVGLPFVYSVSVALAERVIP